MNLPVTKVFKFFTQSLSFRLFSIFIIIMIGLFFLYARLCTSYSRRLIEETVRMEAYRSGDLIRQSLYRMMLLNDREYLRETIRVLGNEPGVERVRIYNKKGTIQFSSQLNEIGGVVDMNAEACYICHNTKKPDIHVSTENRVRIFRTTDNRRIMGLIIPIYNENRCSSGSCHAHSAREKILGVLDIQMSLEHLDQAVARNRRTIYSISMGFLFLGWILVFIVLYIGVYKPVSILKIGTERLAAGELGYRIKLLRQDELGLLASSFNHMAENLQQAYEELKEWSRTLEKRVEEKTAELETMHQEILHVERMASLGKMAATVAHELNNPLAGIVNYTKLLQRKLSGILAADSPEKTEMLKELELIRSESLRCGNIVKNLLVFARGSAVNFQDSDIEFIVNRAMDLVRHHFELAGIKYSTEFKVQERVITCDSEQLVQALVALMVNAVEAMPHGGKLTVRVLHPDNDTTRLQIQVSDTGVGIPPEVQKHIFEPFFTTKEEKKGVGLGLAVVYGIIQRHKGRIWVKSQPGKGTTFYLELPTNPDQKLEA